MGVFVFLQWSIYVYIADINGHKCCIRSPEDTIKPMVTVSRCAVSMLTSPWNDNRLPPAVILVLLTSSFV